MHHTLQQISEATYFDLGECFDLAVFGKGGKSVLQHVGGSLSWVPYRMIPFTFLEICSNFAGSTGAAFGAGVLYTCSFPAWSVGEIATCSTID